MGQKKVGEWREVNLRRETERETQMEREWAPGHPDQSLDREEAWWMWVKTEVPWTEV